MKTPQTMNEIKGLTHLPSEVLLQILALLETRELLLLTVVSHRFYSLIVRILNARIVLAAPPAGLELILDCYRPAAKYSEPALNCVYLGTDGLEEVITAGGLETGSPGERLKQLNSLYSRFRPLRRPEPKPRWHPAGDIPGSRTYSMSTRAAQRTQQQAQSFQAETYPRPHAPNNDANQDETGQDAAYSASPNGETSSTRDGSSGAAAESLPAVKLLVHLDSSELFTQLCTSAMLVIPGPKSGLFRSSVPVHDCIIRVWRPWLAKEAAAAAAVPQLACETDDTAANSTAAAAAAATTSRRLSSDKGKGKAPATTNIFSSPLSARGSLLGDECGVIWSNKSKEICMRFGVCEVPRQSGNRSVYQRVDSDGEDAPVTYELEFQEILVRTSHLLFKMEEARTQLHDSTGKAMVFGQFN